ncbi:MAG: NAD(P)-dependent alcohol dehydrogenase [Holophagales bacterium]|nr:NAD(P)-dependent alcohol dehydrogenase [Holophagales bacterium]MBK9964608.1 NAD(P)-dependent alcohol dehydrogenase [Holophagales bacterium]
MRALCYERHGDPRDGVVKNVFDPRPGPGQLVVRVVAAALNPADWKIVEGKFPFLLLPKTPFVPGCEAAGIVEAMDARVSGFRAGDEVIVSTGLRGALAEKVAVSALQVARKPANLSFEEAAAIPAAGQTALQALCDVAGVKAGQRLLVNGAGGGIGTFAVQVGKLLGAHVTAVASAGKHEILSGLGADALLDYRKDDFTRARQEWDVVFDVVPNRSFGECSRVLSREGVYVTTLPGAGPLFASLGASFRAPFGFRKRCRWVILKPRGADLDRLVGWAGEGRLKPVVGKVAPLDQAAWALSDLSAGHATGKTVVRVA